MSSFLGAVSLGVVWLMGALALGVSGLRREDGTDLPLELATGAALLGTVGTVLVLVGVPLTPLFGYVLLAVLAGLAWWRRFLPVPRLPPWPTDRVALGLLAAAALLLVVVVSASLVDRLSWDGWAIWVLKARILFLDGGLPADVWARPGPFEFAHPDYPLALPLLDWWLFAHAGRPLPALASFAGAIWFAMLAWLVWAAAGSHRPGDRYRGERRRVDGREARWAAAATLGLAAFWPVAYYAVGGTADVVMTLAILGAAVELERGAREGTTRPLIRGVVYLFLAAVTKNEGLALGLIGGTIVGVILARRREREVRLYVAAMAPAAAGLLWRAWSSAMGVEVEQLGSPLDLGGAVHNAVLVLRALGEMALYRQWPPLLLVIGVGAWRWRTASLRWQTPAWALLAVYCAVVVSVYLVTEEDLVWLLDTTLRRIASTVAPAAVYLTVRGLGPGEPA